MATGPSSPLYLDEPVGFVYLIVHQARALYLSTAVEESVGKTCLSATCFRTKPLPGSGNGAAATRDPALWQPPLGHEGEKHRAHKRGFGGYLAPLVRRQAPWPVSGQPDSA